MRSSEATLRELFDRVTPTIEEARSALQLFESTGMDQTVLDITTAAVQLYDAAALMIDNAPTERPRVRRHDPHHLPSVTEMLSVLGFRTTPFIDMAYAFARGTAIHRACELDDRGTLDEASVDAAVLPFLRGFRKFKLDTGSTRIIHAEVRVSHPTYGFSFTGQFDSLRWFQGRRALADFKTNTVDPATVLQLALYDLLLPFLPDAPTAVGRGAEHWIAVAIKPDDYTLTIYTAGEREQAHADALALVRTYHALSRMRGR
jgi:hypothetical protein